VKTCSKCSVEKPFEEFYQTKSGHRSACRACCQIYRDQNKAKKKEHYLANKPAILLKVKAYEESHKEELREYRRNYTKDRLKNDPTFKLAFAIRTRLRVALRRQYKSGSAVKDLGCSIEYLKAHLESQFKPGMSWENHGDWHIDHIIPLSKFDLTNRQEFLKACHFTNLQPLWAIENFRKGDKIYQIQSHTETFPK
jgi:hypothetical protein